MILAPEIQGSLAIQSSAGHFMDAFRQRVASGLLMGRPHPRSNYVVAESAPDRLRVVAADWWTAMNVGLNDVELQPDRPGSVHYRVRYWRWARYAVVGSGLLGLIGIALLLTVNLRGYIAADPARRMLPGLSMDQNYGVAWGMVLFWGFVWPWLLIALHKPALRRVVARVVKEVDTTAAVGGGSIADTSLGRRRNLTGR